MAASSERWEDRAAAAEALAAMDDADSDSALATLLKDEDLAVIEHASACLLALSTAKALRRFTAGYLVVGDQGGDVMNDQLRVAVALNPRLRPALVELAGNGDAGARAALQWLA